MSERPSSSRSTDSTFSSTSKLDSHLTLASQARKITTAARIQKLPKSYIDKHHHLADDLQAQATSYLDSIRSELGRSWPGVSSAATRWSDNVRKTKDKQKQKDQIDAELTIFTKEFELEASSYSKTPNP